MHMSGFYYSKIVCLLFLPFTQFFLSEDKPRLAKIVQTVKTNFNDRYDEVSLQLVSFMKLDPQTLGRWNHGVEIARPCCQARESEGEGTQIEDGLKLVINCIFEAWCLFLFISDVGSGSATPRGLSYL